MLRSEGDRWDWIADSYPAQAVSLRSVADGNFEVVDRTDGRQTIIAEVDDTAAAVTIYEGAIYMVQSVPFQVEKLGWAGRKAFVTRTNVDYYTDSNDNPLLGWKNFRRDRGRRRPRHARTFMNPRAHRSS